MLKTNQKQGFLGKNLKMLKENVNVKKEVKQEKAITLIALVITIVLNASAWSK